MAVRTPHQLLDNSIYFISFTCCRWLPLFELSQTYSNVYKWFERLYEQNIRVIAYVVMPNHIHVMLHFPFMKTSLQVLVGNGKRFLAYEIISRLKQLNEWKLLNELSQYVSSNECKKGQKHKVFEPGFDARLCESSFMVNQKIDYIHYNPVSGKWNLADNYNEYMYSSASFYETGHSDHKWLVHVQEVM